MLNTHTHKTTKAHGHVMTNLVDGHEEYLSYHGLTRHKEAFSCVAAKRLKLRLSPWEEDLYEGVCLLLSIPQLNVINDAESSLSNQTLKCSSLLFASLITSSWKDKQTLIRRQHSQ